MKFVIFHGSFGSPEENWFPELKERLESLGQEVIVPQFPVEDWDDFTRSGHDTVPKKQNLENWLKFFKEKVLPQIKKGEKLCFIGHSIGPVFILHAVDRFSIQLDSAIFVSPFLGKLKDNVPWQFNLVNNSFYKTNFDFNKLTKLIPVSYVLYSNNDPYVDKNLTEDFALNMKSSVIQVRSAGHLNSEVNLNEFPLVLELCKSRLDLSLYQKYLAHRRELFSVDYIKGKSEEVISLDAKEVFDEGIFHFRNLRKSGFCTLYTGTKFWDTQSKYMIEARKAAKRIKNLTRVFVVENLSDLKRKRLLEQINLDLDSEIKVYLCKLADVKDIPEPDFGIWDEDYTCYVHFDKNKQANEVKLSSRRKDIEEAILWKEKILEKSVRIKNTGKDLEEFIKNH